LAGYICGEPRAYSDVDDPVFIKLEYLHWWFRAADTPPLVSTGPQASSGVLGQPGAGVLFGGDDISLHEHLGARVTVGTWFSTEEYCGLEVGYFFLATRRRNFDAVSAGDPLLARPFFNVLTGANDAAPIASLADPADPALVPLAGAVHVDLSSRLWGFDVNGLHNVCRGRGGRLDILCGFRHLSLDEGINVLEGLAVPLDAPLLNGTQFTILDRFSTLNTFYGLQAGARAEVRSGRWTAGASGKLAVGWTHEFVDVFGITTIRTQNEVFPFPGGSVFPGGILALPTNNGWRDQHRLTVVPELSVRVTYDIRDHFTVTLGYNFLFWSSVARPGDQIDPAVNPNQFAPTTVIAGPPSPVPLLRDTSFWAHGLTAGLEIRY
jgi:hypothetical protein